jgi:hypothetical protein
MRQILIGAWLVLASSAIACSGEKFASGSGNDDHQATGSFSSDNENGSQAGRSSAGTSSSTGGASDASGGKPSSAGSSVVPPGVGGSGGSGTSGGSAGSTTIGPTPECAEGKVTFRMAPDPTLSHDYLCDASCGTGWLTLTAESGASALSIFPSCAAVSCESCEALPCAAAACLPTPLTAEGTQLSWSGVSLVADSCGMDTVCQRQSCVPPGKYKAKACANVNAGQNGMNGGCMPKDGIVLCSEAEFEFPGTEEVVLLLKKPD